MCRQLTGPQVAVNALTFLACGNYNSSLSLTILLQSAILKCDYKFVAQEKMNSPFFDFLSIMIAFTSTGSSTIGLEVLFFQHMYYFLVCLVEIHLLAPM